MKRLYILIACLVSIQFSIAQKIDKKLQRKIEALVKDFGGDVGVYVKHLKKNRTAAFNADTIFPTASIVKIPILVGITDKIEKGELGYHQELTYKDSLLYAGVDILGSFKSGEKIELSKLMMLMITMSDNTASLWLQSLAGTGTRINGIMDSLGFVNTKVNSRTPGREAIRSKYGWGQSTPREIASLLQKIYNGEIVSKEASERMLRILRNVYWDDGAFYTLPPHINVFAKTGAVNQTRNEVMLVNAPNGDYVFAVMTKNQKDSSWVTDNEGWKLIRKISEAIWKHYQPKSKWQPMVKDRNKWF